MILGAPFERAIIEFEDGQDHIAQALVQEMECDVITTALLLERAAWLARLNGTNVP